MPHYFHLKPLFTALTVALLSTSALPALAQNTNAAPAAEQQQHRIELPAGSLATSLNTLARQTGITLSADPTLVDLHLAPALSGDYTVQQALNLLLADTGLSVTRSIDGGYSIVEPQSRAQTLPPVKVSADTLGATTEGTGSYTTGVMPTATRLNLSILETPQSVSVITTQQIVDRNAKSLKETLDYAPGISVTQGLTSNRWRYLSRGQTIDSIQYDGLSSSLHYYSRDTANQENTAMYDRVEILKGAAGLTDGSGNPSGVINLVRKRPTDALEGNYSAGASSFENASGDIDISVPMNESWGSRFVVSANGGDGYRDYNSDQDFLGYAIVEGEITKNTTVSLAYSYQNSEEDGFDWAGLPTKPDGSFYNFDSGDYLGSDWARNDRTTHQVYADIETRLQNDWVLKVSARTLSADADFIASLTIYSSDDLVKYDGNFDYDYDARSSEINLSGPLQLFGRTHDIAMGVSYNDYEFTTSGGYVSTYTIDPLTWDPESVSLANSTSATASTQEQNEKGIYFSGNFELTDRLNLVTGARVAWYDYNASGTDYSNDAEPIPYVGLVYKINSDTSVYASYTTTFMTQTQFDIDGDLLDPLEGINYETGIKKEFFDGNLNGGIALFQSDQENIGSAIDGLTYCHPSSSRCYKAEDLVRTRGIEFEVSGALTEKWNIGTGYTYANSEYGSGDSKGERYNGDEYPEHIFKITSSYDINDRFTIGGAARWLSDLSVKSDSHEIRQPSYGVVDMMARYNFTKFTDLQINIDNLFSKEYYSAIEVPSYGNYIGAPRKVSLTLTHQFR